MREPDHTRRVVITGLGIVSPIGNTVGDVGAAVQQLVEANGFSVVRDFVGHGIGTEMHEAPQVTNYRTAHRGRRGGPTAHRVCGRAADL